MGRIRSASRYAALATCSLLLGACAHERETPGVPWLLAANVLSLAGRPPTPPDFYAEPVRVDDELELASITAGADHTCALAAGGDTYCWGSSQYQQLGGATVSERCGNGAVACSSTPVRLEGAPRFTALAASIWGTCGLDASGAAYCWGFGLGGRRGDALPASSGAPVAVPGGHRFSALASGPAANRTCGLAADGVWCWRYDGAPGGGSSAFSGPDRVAQSSSFVAIGVGTEHACGIDAQRAVSCWGSNQFGQLGVGSSALEGGLRESAVPVAVLGQLQLERIAAGPGHSCGLDAHGAAYCWGLGFVDDAGRAALPRAPDRGSIAHGSAPVAVDLGDARWVALGAGTTRICGLSPAGDLYCLATTPGRRGVVDRPAKIESDQPWTAFAVGGSHACALGADRLAYCWGSSHLGQVGRHPSGRVVSGKANARRR